MIFINRFILALSSMPIRIPTDVTSLLWALPICLSISVVYKAIKIEEFTLPGYLKEVGLLFTTIIGFLIIVAIGLLIVAKFGQVI